MSRNKVNLLIATASIALITLAAESMIHVASAQLSGSSQSTRQQADQLIDGAYQAMGQSDWAGAEALILRAESLGVTYLPTETYWAKTPQRARRDMQSRRGGSLSRATRGGAPAELDPRTIQQAPPLYGSQPIRLTADRSLSNFQPQGATPMAGPPTATRSLPSAFHAARPIDPARQQSRVALKNARLALAVGDVRRAMSGLDAARKLNLSYQPNEDSPAKVENAIQQYSDVSNQQDGSQAYRRRYAKALLAQADVLIGYGELDQADRLANSALMQNVEFAVYDTNPRDMLKKISDARRSGRAPIRSISSAGVAPSAAAMQQYRSYIGQARQELNSGRPDKAQQLAQQATSLGVTENALAASEDRPSRIFADLQAYQGGSGAVRLATGNGMQNNMATHAVYNPQYDGTRGMQVSGASPSGGMSLNVRSPQGTQMNIRPPVGSNYAAPASNPVLPTAYQPTPANPNTRMGFRGEQNVSFAQHTQPTGVPTPAIPSNPPSALMRPGGGSPMPSPMTMPSTGGSAQISQAEALFEQGLAALEGHNTNRAYELFRQAYQYKHELDPITLQRLQQYLQAFAGSAAQAAPAVQPGTALDQATAQQRAIAQQLQADINHAIANARRQRDAGDPKGSLVALEEVRSRVSGSSLEPATRAALTARVDRVLVETQRYIEKRRPLIELKERNDLIRDEIKQENRLDREKEQKLKSMTSRFQQLMDEGRDLEAKVIAKQAMELAPEEPIAKQLIWIANLRGRMWENDRTRDAKEQGFLNALAGVDKSSEPWDDSKLIEFPANWGELTARRQAEIRREMNRTEAELEIEEKLRNRVTISVANRPLNEVLEQLRKMVDVNMFIDEPALREFGVDPSHPVSLQVQEISLKSALNLLLNNLGLNYAIDDEVLKITSETGREGSMYTVTYNVADLVIPIPNYVPNQRLGLAGAYYQALGAVGFSGNNPAGGMTSGPMPTLASSATPAQQHAAGVDASRHIMGQMSGMGAGGATGPVGFGPGGAGSASQADFDSLMNLITATVQPRTWQEVGGVGSIAPFAVNNSMVISQTQDVHEDIVDLLEQLRRMQDLQVTIEVRFITLNDNFFERIGVDFDFDINDDIDRPFQVFGRRDSTAATPYSTDLAANSDVSRTVLDQDHDRSVTVGMSAPGVFSADMDIPFSQGSYLLAVPQFGGFDASAGAQLGFAILSDIEAFFFINAAQGDRRSNILQAPKVTLFNGQQAFVSDTTQSPFVISVVPVVGDFAVSQQPIIVVLNEGTYMTVQAVVSQDRRYVRLTVVPFFSQIGDVEEFVFNGSTTTTTDGETDSGQVVDPDNPDSGNNNVVDKSNTTTTNTGTTVQLPTFSFVTVTTTVSVPDGGTILLGGIKRLSEGRNEFGTPILNKIPYLNRLFKNVGIGRETQSLMMMVTPRIIIQEEEEQNFGIQSP